MNNDNENFEKSINTLIEYASSILKLTLGEIKEKFSDNSVKQFNYTRRNKLEESVEIRFENEWCSFQCEFDKNRYCCGVYMFFDFNLEAYDYKTILNSNYKYRWLLKTWRTPKSRVKVIKEDDLVYIKVF